MISLLNVKNDQIRRKYFEIINHSKWNKQAVKMFKELDKMYLIFNVVVFIVFLFSVLFYICLFNHRQRYTLSKPAAPSLMVDDEVTINCLPF